MMFLADMPSVVRLATSSRVRWSYRMQTRTMEDTAGVAVPAAVDAVTVGPAGQGGDRGGAAPVREER